MTLFTRKHKLASKRIYEGGIINLRVDELQAQDGSKTIREVVEHNGGVVICCQPDPNQVVLVKQYRYSLDKELIELPAGRIDAGEKPLSAAQRELVEETGYEAKQWQGKGVLCSAPGFSNELLYLFLATDVRQVGKRLDQDEETEVLVLPIDRAWDLISAEPIADAKTIAALAILMNERRQVL
jgi:ADP-ribose pyrophosphatase